MKQIIFTFIFCLITETAFASLLINGDLLIKINFGQTASGTVAAINQEDGSHILLEDGGVLLYD